MFFPVIKKGLTKLFKQPMRLLGLMMLAVLLTCLSYMLFWGIPAVGYAVGALAGVSVAWIFLRAVRSDEESKATDLFRVCGDGETFRRVLIGTAWKDLWVLIWGLIPIAGIVLALMKAYEYRLVPYILMDDPEMKPIDAIKASSEKSKGYRGKLFLSDLLMFGVFVVILAILWVIGMLIGMYAGRTAATYYLIVMAVILIAAAVFCKLLAEAARAAFYEEILHPTPKPVRVRPAVTHKQKPAQPADDERFCIQCGTKYKVGEAVFCPKCGCRLDDQDE